MSESAIKSDCTRCRGTGNDNNSKDANGNILINPCPACGATGKIAGSNLDTTDIMEMLGKIHGKVEAIWNKVK